MKIPYVLKGSHENPCTRATKKTQQQQKTQSATYGFCLDFIDTFVGKCNGVQARRGVRGPPGPTIIIIKEIIRFNNNNNNNKWFLYSILLAYKKKIICSKVLPKTSHCNQMLATLKETSNYKHSRRLMYKLQKKLQNRNVLRILYVASVFIHADLCRCSYVLLQPAQKKQK